MKNLLFIAFGLAIIGFVVFRDIVQMENSGAVYEQSPVAPDWTAIASWPPVDATTIEAIPDPNRRITAVVLDDSGSMGPDIEDAKTAVITALDAMAETDRVAVIALNAGVILPFSSVGDARVSLPDALRQVYSGGGTPLTQAVRTAAGMLEREAAVAQAFGTYRMIVTTDGVADDGAALVAVVEFLAETTPIQMATIGIGIGNAHVLSRSDIGSFVDVGNVAALAEALQQAVAENTNFAAITDFSEGN